jgi:predicted porin
MKKTLVALAALAATSAFAQTSVVIDGYFDRGYTVTNSTDGAKDTKGVASSAGTTTIGFKVREDLGNGLSVGGSVNTDWNDLGGAQQKDVTGTAQRDGFANSQSFLDVTSKQYGTLRLGTPNSFTLTNATAVTSPAYSTGVGSSYSSSFSIASGVGTGKSDQSGLANVSGTPTAAANAGQRSIRISNTIQYSSPVFLNGLTAHVGFTPKNDNVASGTAGNTIGAKEFALRYTNGAVDTMFTTVKYSIGDNGIYTATNGGTAAAVGTAGLTSTQNLLGVTYAVLPSLKLHGGYGTFSSSTDAYKGNSKQIGATYTTGAWDLSGQIAKVDDKSATDIDRKMAGLGVNYNFSKTTRAYFRYDNINYATNQNSIDGSKLKRTAIGVSKSF